MPIKLYDYQQSAVEKLKTGAILCGGVGSGKSLTSLTYYFEKVGKGRIQGKYEPMKKPIDLYIITTARKRDTLEWERELLPFCLSSKKDISNYGIKVVIDSWNNITKYTDATNSFFIFDEQRVVGSGAWAKAFIKISKKNKWILLSATPGDTWMDYVPVFIANGFFKNKTDFVKQHVVYSRFSKFPKVDRYINTGALIKMRKDILIDMDYKKHTESHNQTIQVDYDEALYKDIQKNRWNPFENKPIENVSELCYLLRKVINSDESRCEAVLDLAERIDRVIIFYNYNYELELLKSLPYREEQIIAEWNGHKHQPIPDSDYWVYLVQYTAGAEGWNCTKTDSIIFFSQNYSYKIMTQSSGRIDRLNTPYNDLYFYHLKSQAPIDKGIDHALKRKENFNERKFFA